MSNPVILAAKAKPARKDPEDNLSEGFAIKKYNACPADISCLLDPSRRLAPRSRMTRTCIAIDGPSASGKGTIAKLLGERLELPVLYTGNIYRAIAHKVIEADLDPHQVEQVVLLAKQLKLEDLENPNLMAEKTGQYASIIGVYPQLRDATYQFQRDFIENNNGAVIEGRDIGTVICPEADYKFYITADVEVRAKRRFAQQPSSNYEQILADLKVRDERDQNRAVAPLKPAIDAVIIDSSELGAEETLANILKIIK